MIRPLTAEEIARWEVIKYEEDKDKVLDFCTALAKDTKRVVLTGIKDANMLVKDDRWQWMIHWLCQKPPARYLTTMGTLYKVYPNGRVVSSAQGTDWVGRKVKCVDIVRKGVQS